MYMTKLKQELTSFLDYDELVTRNTSLNQLFQQPQEQHKVIQV